jgi:hypothetical protein
MTDAVRAAGHQRDDLDAQLHPGVADAAEGLGQVSV